MKSLRKCVVLGLAGLILFGLPPATDAQNTGYDWLQWNGNAQHTGNNAAETRLGPSTIGRLQRIYQVTLPSVVDGAVLFLRSVKTSQGVMDLLFMTTKTGDLLAVAAKTGAIIWTQHHNNDHCFVDQNEIQKVGSKLACWTTSIPAIDPSRAYVYSYGLDGYVHKHHVEDGSEVTTNGWPELVTRKPWLDKVSPALTIATTADGTSYLYATSSGYPMPEPGDWGDYQGHLVAINLDNGASNVFNALCSNIRQFFMEKPASPSCPAVKAGIWARGGVSYSPDTDRIYISTGNGTFDPANFNWADSVLALNPDGSGTKDGPLDSFTPANFQSLTNSDTDLAVYLPFILPAPKGGKYAQLIVQGGKDGSLRLLNPSDLSGQHGPGFTGGELAPPAKIPLDTEITNSPAQWINPIDSTTWLFTPTYFGTAAWQLVIDQNGDPLLKLMWQNTKPCTAPVLANNVLYCAAFKNLWAFSPTTGQQLWSVYPIGEIHWQSPVVANGTLYMTDQSAQLMAYAPQ